MIKAPKLGCFCCGEFKSRIIQHANPKSIPEPAITWSRALSADLIEPTGLSTVGMMLLSFSCSRMYVLFFLKYS